MVRNRFREGKRYAARLSRVVQRPIENEPSSGVCLMRLEFEVFLIEDDPQPNLRSTGKIACRDLVVGPAVCHSRDASLTAYLRALDVPTPFGVRDWLDLTRTVQHRWITLEFGPVNPLDQRNSFQKIGRFACQNREVIEYDYDLDKQWVSVKHAADEFGASESTIRRRVENFEAEHGEQLQRRTKGGHRRINLPLLRNLWK